MSQIRLFPGDSLSDCGGKARNLGTLLQAGFPVPPGFCASAQATVEQIRASWQEHLGRAAVAVRSSALLEDGAQQSFAGQFATVLEVKDAEALVEAAAAVRSSMPEDGWIIVQRMVEAKAAGVIFTVDPTIGQAALRLEAVAGLGEGLVSGRLRPSAWRIEENVVSRLDGPPVLAETAVLQAAEAARGLRTLLGSELDVEFAFDAEDRLWLLQARPITADISQAERVCAQEREKLQRLAEPQGTVWSRYSLAESLPAPVPMTWSLVSRMMSGRGGYGRLYRDLGFDPDPSLDELGVIDLVCGRPYYNLSREARLYFSDFPFSHSLQAIRSDPRRGSYPTPEVNLQQAGPHFWRRLPRTLWKMFASHRRVETLQKTFAARFVKEIAPAFVERMKSRAREDLADLSSAALLQRLHGLQAEVLDDFAAEAFKPSAFAALAVGKLEKLHGSAETARLLEGVRPLPEADLGRWLADAAAGKISLAELVVAIGHRGPAEMELSQPRWSEIPEQLRASLVSPSPVPAAQPDKGRALEGSQARLWLSLRETARHWLMLGFAELRRTLLALDDKLGLHGEIFWWRLEELDGRQSPDVAERRRLHRLMQSLYVPPVLFSDDLAALGRNPEPLEGDSTLEGTPLSWGSVQGPALVVRGADEVPAEAHGYVLVCPSTDPAYTAAMSRAVALVVETGGVLSHGAIVAREMGLPAVANVPIRSLRSGMLLTVDGQRGLVIPAH